MIKAKAHQLLETSLHRIASEGKGVRFTLTIPYYEIARELGFQEKGQNIDVRLTIQTQFIDDDGDVYGDEESATADQTRN